MLNNGQYYSKDNSNTNTIPIIATDIFFTNSSSTTSKFMEKVVLPHQNRLISYKVQNNYLELVNPLDKEENLQFSDGHRELYTKETMPRHTNNNNILDITFEIINSTQFNFIKYPIVTTKDPKQSQKKKTIMLITPPTQRRMLWT